MTKKDYELIARVLRSRMVTVYAQAIAQDFANEIAQDSPCFDRERFLAACGVER